MTYVPYDNFMRAVLPFVPGAPEVLAYDAVRNAAIEFCEETGWLQYTPDPQNGIANIAQYAFDSPNDTIVGQVSDAWWDGFNLVAKSQDQLRDLCGVDWRIIQGQPRYYTTTDNADQIVVVPYPLITETLALTALVTIRPSRDSLTVDSGIYEWWLDTIAAGAISRLMAMPAQSFTNMAGAATYAGAFRLGVNKAKIERNRGQVRANLVFRPPAII